MLQREMGRGVDRPRTVEYGIRGPPLHTRSKQTGEGVFSPVFTLLAEATGALEQLEGTIVAANKPEEIVGVQKGASITSQERHGITHGRSY